MISNLRPSYTQFEKPEIPSLKYIFQQHERFQLVKLRNYIEQGGDLLLDGRACDGNKL